MCRVDYKLSTREAQDYCDEHADCVAFSAKFVPGKGMAVIVHTNGPLCQYRCDSGSRWSDDPSLITRADWTDDFSALDVFGTDSWLLDSSDHGTYQGYGDARCFVTAFDFSQQMQQQKR